jgi:hypothetical protein
MADLRTQLEQYLVETTDPVDVDQVVAQSQNRDTTAASPPRRWGIATAVAVAVAVLVVVGVPLGLLGVLSGDSPVDESITVPPASVFTTIGAEETVSTAAVQRSPVTAGAAARAVEDLHAAWNAGDLPGVIALLAPTPGTDPGMRNVMERAIDGLGARLEAECSDPVENLSDGFDVACSVSLLDDRFYTVAGVSWTQEVIYMVTDAGIDTRTGFFWSHGPTGDAYEFLREFDSWLFERDQGGQVVAGWIWVDPDNGLQPNWLDGRPCCMYSVETLAAAKQLPDLVPEFLADIGGSWPIGTDFTSEEVAGDLTLRYYVEDEDYTVISAMRGDKLVFTLTQCPGECFAQERRLTRSPDGVLSTVGFQGAVWKVNEYGQTEIAHLWPPDTAFDMDVLWLTDYTGSTRDTLTGFTPAESDTFTLHDELVLETRTGGKGLFALHTDCQTDGDDIGAALISFENENPVVLIGWSIDYTTMKFTQVDDPNSIEIGGCYTPTARP